MTTTIIQDWSKRITLTPSPSNLRSFWGSPATSPKSSKRSEALKPWFASCETPGSWRLKPLPWARTEGSEVGRWGVCFSLGVPWYEEMWKSSRLVCPPCKFPEAEILKLNLNVGWLRWVSLGQGYQWYQLKVNHLWRRLLLFSFWGPRHFSRTEVMIWFFTKAGVWGFKPLKGALEHTEKNVTFPTCVVPVHVVSRWRVSGVGRHANGASFLWTDGERCKAPWATPERTQASFPWLLWRKTPDSSGEVRWTWCSTTRNKQWETMMMLTSDDFMGVWFVYDLYFVELLLVLDVCENALRD